jgi:hypothetical protein
VRHKSVLLGFAILIMGLGAQAGLAQTFEIYPYAGGIFPGDWRDTLQLKRDGIYGVKGGVFFGDLLQLEGNFGYINHFEFEKTDPKSRAFIWEAGPSMNFFSSMFERAVPYISIQAGGITGFVGDPENVADNSDDFAAITPTGGPSVTLEDGDTFFQFSYGGGIKGYRLWGPLGLRAEVRGRTIPNFFGNSTTWLETTGGVTFNWGER